MHAHSAGTCRGRRGSWLLDIVHCLGALSTLIMGHTKSMFRRRIPFALCFMLGVAHRWEAVPKNSLFVDNQEKPTSVKDYFKYWEGGGGKRYSPFCFNVKEKTHHP